MWFMEIGGSVKLTRVTLVMVNLFVNLTGLRDDQTAGEMLIGGGGNGVSRRDYHLNQQAE